MDLRTQYWNLLLVEPLMRGLRFLADDLGLGAGLAIILFTLIIRVVLLPLTIQQVRSQKSMQQLQPELKALQKKFGSDREKLSQETMALYKQHGVNPAASCLPLALQMPVLFALYAALRNLSSGQVCADPICADPSFQQPWLWLAGLQHPDVIKDIWIGGAVVASLPFALPGVLPVLAAITQWIQQRMMTPQTDDPQQKMQNQMMQFMPLMMLWFGLSFQSGLALYWVTQNVVGIVQQYFTGSNGWGSLPFLGGRGQLASDGTTGNGSLADGTGAAVSGRNVAARGGGRNGRSGDGTGNSGGSGGSGGAGGGGGRARREGRRASGKR